MVIPFCSLSSIYSLRFKFNWIYSVFNFRRYFSLAKLDIEVEKRKKYDIPSYLYIWILNKFIIILKCLYFHKYRLHNNVFKSGRKLLLNEKIKCIKCASKWFIAKFYLTQWEKNIANKIMKTGATQSTEFYLLDVE